MIWKIVMVLSIALCVQGEEDAISEQRVVIHHQKSVRVGALSHNGADKSGNQDEYAHAYPSYEFSYKVHDPKTHDFKGQHEIREGDEVTGNYWLIEPNGRKRTVNYQANDDSGFNAQIDYTASLKGKETDEDVNVSQDKTTEEANTEENDEEGVEISIAEETPAIQESKNESENNSNSAPAEENNLTDQNEPNNQKDEANNKNNADRNDGEDLAQNSEGNLDNNEGNLRKSRKVNKPIYDADKSKYENTKKNKNYYEIWHENKSNTNNREKPKNGKLVKQDQNVKQNENNNRNSHKGKNSNRNRNVHNEGNINNDDPNVAVNKGQINVSQEKTERKKYELRKEEKNNYNKPNHNPNNKYYAHSDEIQRKIDIPDSEETFEHRIRIYHPKNILATPKQKQR